MRLTRTGMLGLGPNSRKAREEVSLVPLISVVFLILIFFLIAGRLEPPDRVPVDPPVSASQSRPEETGLALVMAADGRIAAAGEIMWLERLAGWLAVRLQSQTSVDGADEAPRLFDDPHVPACREVR